MSKRAEHRRAEREKRKPRFRLTAEQIILLNKERTLPRDHPSIHKGYYIPSPLELATYAMQVFKRSGVLPYLERKLRNHPGGQSSLPILALLVTMLVAAAYNPSYRRTDLCAILNGLEAEVAYKLGLSSTEARTLFSYNMVNKQCLRLEKALKQGWTDDEDGTKCGFNWFSHCLLKAIIPRKLRRRITAVAADSTFVFSWANPHRTPMGEDLPEGQCSADPDARFGHYSATGKRNAGIGLGYHCQLLTAILSRKKWKGDPRKANFVHEREPMIVLGMAFDPGNADLVPRMVECIKRARQIAPNLKETVADRGYSMKPRRFIGQLHEAGVEVIFDYDKIELFDVKPLTGGKYKHHHLNVNCGTLIPTWLPENLQKPPPLPKGKNLTEEQEHERRTKWNEQQRPWFDQRAQYRYSPVEVLKNGSIRFQCPQCAGRIRSNKKTRNPNVKPARDAPTVHRKDDAEYCCPGRVTISVKNLDRYQPIPYGTTAHYLSYSRRNQVENLNGMVKDKGGLDDGWCRALGIAPRFIAALMVIVAHQMREIKAWLIDNPDLTDDNDAETDTDQNDTDNPIRQTDRSRDGPD